MDNSNFLVSQFPTSANVDGIEHELNTDFRASLQTLLAFEDNGLTEEEKTSIMLQNLFLEIPDNVITALDICQWFLNGGTESSETDEVGDGWKLYSFHQDAMLIFAAFRSTHGIDLQKEEMHWWKFLALFMDLGSSTAFCQLVASRKRIHSGNATPEEKKAAREMGALFEIEQIDSRSIREKEQSIIFDKMVEEQKRKIDGN